jgi:hypothetical protein
MAILLQSFNDFDLWKIEREDLVDFTKFVLRVNYEHHLQTSPPIEEVEACVKKDKDSFSLTHCYAMKTKNGQTFGTINVSKWNGRDEFDIDKEFNLNVKELIKTRGLTPPEIWHIGRFATDRKIINSNRELRLLQAFYFQLLLTCVFHHICAFPDNVMFAECDIKLQKTLNTLGIFSEELAEPHIILGSETVPIFNTGAGLQQFYDNHKHLIPNVLSQ